MSDSVLVHEFCQYWHFLGGQMAFIVDQGCANTEAELAIKKSQYWSNTA